MRRIFGYVVFAVGCLLIFLAPLLYFYTKPRVEKAPIDVYDKSVSVGSARVLSAQVAYVVGPFPAENISIAKSNQKASSKDVAVISIFNRTRNLQTGKDFNYDLTIYAMDRATGEAVRCGCGETPGIQGTTLKFPFGTRKQTYSFYDYTAHKPFPARYLRTESLEGLDVYVFRSDVPATQIGTLDLPGSLIGAGKGLFPTDRWYAATTTLWVEPVTGAIVKAGQVSSQWATYQGKYAITLAQSNFLNDLQSVGHTAEQVRTKVYQLRLVELWIPFFGPVAGVVFIAMGLLLLGSLRPTRPAREPARAEAFA
ncbi:MAG TPA: DUF3068 domain-containing protein [Actinomycetota bacterium]